MESNIQLEKIYTHRFPHKEDLFRNKMWKILCSTYLQKFFGAEDTVLDLPCGHCEFINNIKVKTKYGLDINKTFSNYANKKVTFLHALSTKIPLRSKSVDKIFISNFFEHLTKEQIKDTVIECKRILRKSGKIIILQPNIRYCSPDYWMFFDHITPIDDRALDEIFFANNFTPVKKIKKFLPYTTKNFNVKFIFLLQIYIRIPLLWLFFGKQSLLIYANGN